MGRPRRTEVPLWAKILVKLDDDGEQVIADLSADAGCALASAQKALYRLQGARMVVSHVGEPTGEAGAPPFVWAITAAGRREVRELLANWAAFLEGDAA